MFLEPHNLSIDVSEVHKISSLYIFQGPNMLKYPVKKQLHALTCSV